MSTEASATPEAPAQEPENPTAEASKDGEQPKADDTDWKAEARKWEQRAKENGTKAAEFDKQRKAAMTDAERAVAEAEERGRTVATSEFGKRLATSEIRAAAADAKADLAGVFDYLDLSRFVGDDGEPNGKEIEKFVASLPKKEAVTPSFDGGTRTPAPVGADMNTALRKATGRA